MRDDMMISSAYRVVIMTLDAHAAGPCQRALLRLRRDFPDVTLEVYAAAEWTENPDAFRQAEAAVARADIVISTLLFLDEHVSAILPALKARRDDCDAMVCMIADAQIVRLTRMGGLDMSKPSGTFKKFLGRLRGSSKPSSEDGARKMRLLRRLPRILKYLPGTAQDLRAWFLCMQYWLGSSDDNMEAMVRFLLGRYSERSEWSGAEAAAPREYPDVGLYHPDLKDRITTNVSDLPNQSGTKGTVGILMMRSYVLSSDCAHYDAVIRALESRGLAVIPAFAGGLDGRPALKSFFKEGTERRVDAILSLTGFSLVGGPAYNDSAEAVRVLTDFDVPYISAHPLEFQTLGQWAGSKQGLGPIETTMLVALPELDGASQPGVFAGRHDDQICQGCERHCVGEGSRAMAPCPERVEMLADRLTKQVALRRSKVFERRVGIVLFGFPPNAGAAGTAAYLDVFASLLNTLRAMEKDGYDVTPPKDIAALREAVLGGNAKTYGQEANIAHHVSAEDIVSQTPWLSEIEACWGPAPGRVQSDGRGVYILGAHFGKVFVGLQPGFGYEGDPMRLLFEHGQAPTHAFAQFYLWLRRNFNADVLLHFGMHGALEFMPGRQVGMGPGDWSDRLIADMPNVYLYAANNPSEASLAKRRSGAVTVSHLTPPLAQSGLYKGLQELKESLTRWRQLEPDDPERATMLDLIKEQAEAVDMLGAPEGLWKQLLETEAALIPDGLHIVGADISDKAKEAYISLHDGDTMRDQVLRGLEQVDEAKALMHALGGQFVAPVPGGDLIRSPEILPTGRNIHAFDPFRMPTAHACREGARQAQLLLDTHHKLPRSIALVLWGSDNIKSDGGPIGQALALMGARPRFDAFGRLCGAELIPLSELGRPRIDVVMTLSGIFRDLLPLQIKMLAEAALLAAEADEPLEKNFIRAHALANAKKLGVSLHDASLRVFSNAQGAYGSNVNQLVELSAFSDEDELADAYQTRKGFCYGVDGKAKPGASLLAQALSEVEIAYQNLESIELGVTTVDHYFDTLGGVARAVRRARGVEAEVYIGDQTRGGAKVRRLSDQVALEARSRALNPKFYEGLLQHGAEGVRQIEAHVTNTMGWSTTTGKVEPWVYQRLSETFVLDDAMRQRLADLNPVASSRMANRLLEASDRAYWAPDADTLAALQDAADSLEDQMEGVSAE